MKPKNRVHESMTRMTHLDRTVRIWKTEKGLVSTLGDDTKSEIRAKWNASPMTDQALIRCVEETLGDDLAAIEVLDTQGNGVLLYPNWE